MNESKSGKVNEAVVYFDRITEAHVTRYVEQLSKRDMSLQEIAIVTIDYFPLYIPNNGFVHSMVGTDSIARTNYDKLVASGLLTESYVGMSFIPDFRYLKKFFSLVGSLRGSANYDSLHAEFEKPHIRGLLQLRVQLLNGQNTAKDLCTFVANNDFFVGVSKADIVRDLVAAKDHSTVGLVQIVQYMTEKRLVKANTMELTSVGLGLVR